jgi:hypothetical protein
MAPGLSDVGTATPYHILKLAVGNRFWPSNSLAESEAESLRFHGRRVTKVGPEVKHGVIGSNGAVMERFP